MSVLFNGFKNIEAVGGESPPFVFNLDGVDVVIPNTVSLVVMKLTAMRDRWENFKSKTDKDREFFSEGAYKHAKDVFRAVAMMTREEK